jgi:hypothetical protein
MTPMGASQEAINEGVNAFEELLISAANASLRMTRVKSGHRKRKWYDKSCTVLKQSMHAAKHRYIRDTYNAQARLDFFSLRKQYKKLTVILYSALKRLKLTRRVAPIRL